MIFQVKRLEAVGVGSCHANVACWTQLTYTEPKPSTTYIPACQTLCALRIEKVEDSIYIKARETGDFETCGEVWTLFVALKQLDGSEFCGMDKACAAMISPRVGEV